MIQSRQNNRVVLDSRKQFHGLPLSLDFVDPVDHLAQILRRSLGACPFASQRTACTIEILIDAMDGSRGIEPEIQPALDECEIKEHAQQDHDGRRRPERCMP